MNLKRVIAGLTLPAFVSLLSACADMPYGSSPYPYQGAAAGGAIGAAAGALLDKHNRWRGALIGGALGAALGGTVTEISRRASYEAARSGRPVSYESEDGWQRVEAEPLPSSRRGCRMVRERIWQGGKVVQEQEREICD
nr:hypothetical conserved protein [uncultured Gammaproteobacteria bacterium]